MTVTITPRMPVATAHAFSLPVVREIPPVQRPGMFVLHLVTPPPPTRPARPNAARGAFI